MQHAPHHTSASPAPVLWHQWFRVHWHYSHIMLFLIWSKFLISNMPHYFKLGKNTNSETHVHIISKFLQFSRRTLTFVHCVKPLQMKQN